MKKLLIFVGLAITATACWHRRVEGRTVCVPNTGSSQRDLRIAETVSRNVWQRDLIGFTARKFAGTTREDLEGLSVRWVRQQTVMLNGAKSDRVCIMINLSHKGLPQAGSIVDFAGMQIKAELKRELERGNTSTR